MITEKRVGSNTKLFITLTTAYFVVLLLFGLFAYQWNAPKPANSCVSGAFYGVLLFGVMAFFGSVVYLIFLIFQKKTSVKIRLLAAILPVIFLIYILYSLHWENL